MNKTSARATKIADRALDLLGVKFRLHGRDPEYGLDCIGLVAKCLEAAGIKSAIPNGYSIRGGSTEQFSIFMTQCGFKILQPRCILSVGDIILVQPHILQLHLMVASPQGLVHAHAGLRKVVFTPGEPIWPVIHIYRTSES